MWGHTHLIPDIQEVQTGESGLEASLTKCESLSPKQKAKRLGA
jgi:hypothetical protein